VGKAENENIARTTKVNRIQFPQLTFER